MSPLAVGALTLLGDAAEAALVGLAGWPWGVAVATVGSFVLAGSVIVPAILERVSDQLLVSAGKDPDASDSDKKAAADASARIEGRWIK